jgi:preprotein translocase subunit SecF
MFKIIGETHLDFIRLRKASFLISATLIILGIIAFVMITLGKANLGIDFTGGSMIQGTFEQTMDIGELRRAVVDGGFPEATIQRLERATGEEAYLVRVKETAEGTAVVDQLLDLLATSFPENAFHKDSEHTIGPAVGETLRQQARIAVIIAVLGILIYISIRFDFRSGVAATIATFHDVLTVLGIFWILGIEIDQLVIAALLTLAGYSLTDTVVVFDRIRENLKSFRSKRDYISTINVSINEVLSRTIITSLTVLFVIVTLLFFGGEVLYTFALALFIGVVIGTYSSVFVASPILVEWEARSPKRFK